MGQKIYVDVLRAKGHLNVKALHKSTFEITSESHLTQRGDCIIGVGADKAAAHLEEGLKKALRNDKALLIVLLFSDDAWDYVVAHGNSNLILSSDKKIIVRKSNYIEPATIGVRANKSAIDLDRRLIENLKKGKELIVALIVYSS